jgi:hypothetical protein
MPIDALDIAQLIDFRWVRPFADRRPPIAVDHDPRISSVKFRCGGRRSQQVSESPAELNLAKLRKHLKEWAL